MTDEIADANENNAANNRINNNKVSKCFEYKPKLIVSTPNNHNTLDAKVVARFKYLSKFWRSLHLPLINCEIDLICHGQKNV